MTSFIILKWLIKRKIQREKLSHFLSDRNPGFKKCSPTELAVQRPSTNCWHKGESEIWIGSAPNYRPGNLHSALSFYLFSKFCIIIHEEMIDPLHPSGVNISSFFPSSPTAQLPPQHTQARTIPASTCAAALPVTGCPSHHLSTSFEVHFMFHSPWNRPHWHQPTATISFPDYPSHLLSTRDRNCYCAWTYTLKIPRLPLSSRVPWPFSNDSENGMGGGHGAVCV